jgi:TolA-binding protein
MNIGIRNHGIREGGCIRGAYFQLGVSDYNKGNFASANKNFLKVLHDNTRNFSWNKKAEAAEYLAKIYEAQGNNNQQEKYLELAAEYHSHECAVNNIQADECMELYGVLPFEIEL